MEIRVGKYILRSDPMCIWIEEEYVGKGKDGKPGKVQTRKVAGYTDNIDNLIRQFVAHKHRASEADTMTKLIKELKQIAEDAAELKKTAVANDLKTMREIAKEIKEINKK